MKNSMKFIYVMDKKAKKELLKKGFTLLKEDKANGIWVFENKYANDEACFSLDVECPHVLSDVLTF